MASLAVELSLLKQKQLEIKKTLSSNSAGVIGKSVGRPGPYYNWLLGDRAMIRIEKMFLRDNEQEPEAKPAFQCLLPWIRQMTHMLCTANFVASMHKSGLRVTEFVLVASSTWRVLATGSHSTIFRRSLIWTFLAIHPILLLNHKDF
jgi:hypothetical protein